jgi:hypothetical protein
MGMKGTVRRLVVVGVLAGLGFAGTAPAADAAGIITLTRTPHPVVSFAYDGGRIVYDTSPCTFGPRPTPFHVLRIGRSDIRFAQHGAGCVRVGLGGTQVLWEVAVDGEAFISAFWTFDTEDPRPAQLQIFHDEAVPGSESGPIAGDAGTLAYSWTTFDFENPTTCDQNGTGCDLVVTGGGVRTVAGSTQTRVPSAPPAAAMAVASGRIALVRKVVGQRLSTRWNAVEVRDASDGSLISSFTAGGAIGSIAIAGNSVAVLVRGGGGVKHIEVHDATTGALTNSLLIASNAVGPIDMSKAGILFRRGKVLYIANRSDTFRQPLLVIRGTYAGYGLEGTRVAFAENRDGHGFIRICSTRR